MEEPNYYVGCPPLPEVSAVMLWVREPLANTSTINSK